ncbi:MAG: HupE/UreJ family protein [Pseudomonadota bacterium]
MKSARPVLILLALLAPGLAWAHHETGGQFSLVSGFGHPFLGGDHLLAMLMVGVWAAQQAGWRRALPPVAFVAFMGVGALLAHAGLALPLVEGGIALSVLALGLLAAFAARLPAAAALALIAVFAVFHGHAHGAELPLSASWAYLPGYLAATALLHGIGYVLAAHAERGAKRFTNRLAGAAAALTGLVWLVG